MDSQHIPFSVTTEGELKDLMTSLNPLGVFVYVPSAAYPGAVVPMQVIPSEVAFSFSAYRLTQVSGTVVYVDRSARPCVFIKELR